LQYGGPDALVPLQDRAGGGPDALVPLQDGAVGGPAGGPGAGGGPDTGGSQEAVVVLPCAGSTPSTDSPAVKVKALGKRSSPTIAKKLQVLAYYAALPVELSAKERAASVYEYKYAEIKMRAIEKRYKSIYIYIYIYIYRERER
jgi:hypothetical protein